MALIDPAHAGTTWDGGGANTNIDLADNWDGAAPGVVNALNGTTAAIFGTGGNSANLNVSAYFTSLTFNRDDASGFTVGGTQALSVLRSTSGSSANFTVSNTAANGVTTIDAPFRVNTSAGGTSLLTIRNDEAGASGESLLFSGTVGASTPANLFGLRFGGPGSTRITGALSHVSGIQQALITGANMSGTVTIAGNQTLGSATVQITGTGSGPVASSATIQMGDSITDVQSWGSTLVGQAATVSIKSTATLSGGVALSTGTTGQTSGSILDVSGALSATTLGIGSSVYSGVLKVSGTASFSGSITTGATAGSKIVGGGEGTGVLTLSSGTIGSAVSLGGAGANENNLALVKISGGTLVINRANNTYTGGTTLVHGGGFGSFGLALGANNALGTGPLVIGTAATGANGARFRMAGFDQTVSALSSGGVGTRVIENAGADEAILTVDQTSNTDFSAILRDRTSANAAHVGALSLVKSGSGTLVLSGTSNTHTGTTTLNDGVLEVAALGDAGLARNVTTTLDSAVVTVDSTVGLAAGMTFSAATLPAGATVLSIDGPTQITINDSKTVAGTSVAASFGSASGLGLGTSASNLVFNGGALRYTGATTSSSRGFTINPGKVAEFDVSSGAAVVTLTGTSGASTGGLEKAGAGKLILSGSHGYTGPTTVSSGVLALGGNHLVAVASSLILAGGDFETGGFSQSFASLGLTANGSITLGAANTISFGPSAGQDWGGNAVNFTSFGGSYVPHSVRFGTDSSGLTLGQLGQITVDGIGGYSLDASGFLTAIPEPSAFAALAGLGAIGGAFLRRRRRPDTK